MPFIPVPNTVMAELVYTMHGQVLENTLYFRYEGVPTENHLPLLATSLAVWWGQEMSQWLSSQIALTQVETTILHAANGATFTAVNPTPIAGQKPGEALPGNSALCVSFRTGNSGRSFRGRNYVAGLSEDDHALSQITANTANGIRQAYADLQPYLNGAIESNTPVWVVVSRHNNNNPRVSGVTTPITSVVIVDRYVDSQRRRLIGRGR